MLEHIDLQKVLFLDIETVPYYPEFETAPEPVQKLWEHKAQFLDRSGSGPEEKKTAADHYTRAGIYAEFGKIICVSIGAVNGSSGNYSIRLKSFFGDDEKDFLPEFITLLNKVYNTEQHLLCAHNGKEFDFPYLARRMLINGLKLPGILNTAGKKPWEIRHIDTMELWKFGDFKSFTSLNLLTNVFNIPTPKDDISGADVGSVYWQEKDLPRIVSYCQKDVLAIAQLLLRYKGEPLIEETAVTIV